MHLTLQITDSITDINSDDWDALAGDMPLLSHAFLAALETSGSVGDDTGWQPSHLLFFDDNQLVGAMPLYLKNHSYGEYRIGPGQRLMPATACSIILSSCLPFHSRRLPASGC